MTILTHAGLQLALKFKDYVRAEGHTTKANGDRRKARDKPDTPDKRREYMIKMWLMWFMWMCLESQISIGGLGSAVSVDLVDLVDMVEEEKLREGLGEELRTLELRRDIVCKL
ncbi:unnamed protein product [Ambrosiozyma monospora]|uniref:Unnamed protein product n=1 Tax=Ambrosiozyma monospora TaxID=43982 RepID=A0A9W6WFY0_AMBMO|nr:unnamed protein product [Ambrosiozyma monospora]